MSADMYVQNTAAGRHLKYLVMLVVCGNGPGAFVHHKKRHGMAREPPARARRDGPLYRCMAMAIPPVEAGGKFGSLLGQGAQ